MLKSPYPYFGGKSKIASEVWARFGDVPNLVDPFFGSGALLLSRPHEPRTETVNDVDGWLTNFWRAVQCDPDAVAHYADWPVSELDLHARGDWLFYRKGARKFVEKIRSDPDYYDAKSAGWWVWGASCWIGSGWGPKETGAIVDRARPHLSCKQGITRQLARDSRQLPHLKGEQGVKRQYPRLSGEQGVHRKRPHLADDGKCVNRKIPEMAGNRGGLRDCHNDSLTEYMRELSERFRRVRVCCGDWTRVLGPSVTTGQGLTAVFLDPPYSAEADRDTVYTHDNLSIAHEVREWAIKNGDDPLMRIALCGYAAEHDAMMPNTWERLAWKTSGGYGNQGEGRGRENAGRETIWFSPNCLQPDRPFQPELIAGL